MSGAGAIKQRVIRIGAFLGAGVVVTVLVAWVLVMTTDSRVGWERSVGLVGADGPYYGNRTVRPWVERWMVVRSNLDSGDAELPARWVELPDASHRFAETHAWGWPLRCLVSHVKIGLTAAVFTDSLDWKLGGKTRHLPVRPFWFALLGNAALYGASLAVLWKAPSLVRRLRAWWTWYVGAGSAAGAWLRVVLRAFELAVVGAVLSLLAAWALALTPEKSLGPPDGTMLGTIDGRSYSIARACAFGRERWTVTRPYSWSSARLPGWVAVPTSRQDIATTEAWGWPCCCLAYSQGAARIPTGGLSAYDDAIEFIWGGKWYALPRRPIWGGVVVDVCALGLGFGAIGLGARGLQRVSRRRRGLCVWCEYDMKGVVSGTCPECGR
jgi:hypothetical protein